MVIDIITINIIRETKQSLIYFYLYSNNKGTKTIKLTRKTYDKIPWPSESNWKLRSQSNGRTTNNYIFTDDISMITFNNKMCGFVNFRVNPLIRSWVVKECCEFMVSWKTDGFLHSFLVKLRAKFILQIVTYGIIAPLIQFSNCFRLSTRTKNKSWKLWACGAHRKL